MKKRSGGTYRRRLGFERLEGRAMLAGDVMAEVLANGDLQLTGDAGGESILVQQTGVNANGERSYAFLSGDGTTITDANGQAIGGIDGVTGNIVVDMGGGDNSAIFKDVTQCSLSFTSGAGSDDLLVLGSQLTGLSIDAGDGGASGNEIGVGQDVNPSSGILTPTNISGSLSISGGDGGNFVDVNQVDVGAGVTISTGGGIDTVQFEAVTVQGDTSVSTGVGQDSFTVNDGAFFGGNLSALTGTSSDDDSVVIERGESNPIEIGGGLLIMTSDGNDQVVLSGVDVAGTTLIATGAGTDSVLLNDVNVGTDLYIFSGDGDDSITLSNVAVAGNTWVQTGAGNDQVVVDGGSTFQGSFIVTMGAGDDMLRIQDSTFDGSALVYGGSGTDTLVTNQLTDLAILSFEMFENIMSSP